MINAIKRLSLVTMALLRRTVTMTTIFAKTSVLLTAHVVSAATRPASANVIPRTQPHAVQLRMEPAVGNELSII
jgi:hypothetical protein